jgi:hypothetical protein
MARCGIRNVEPGMRVEFRGSNRHAAGRTSHSVRYWQRFDEKPSETLARNLERTHLRAVQTIKGMTASNSIEVA